MSAVCFVLQADFEMYGSPNHLRISFLGYFRTLYSDGAFTSTQRAFSADQPVFDQYQLSLNEVRWWLVVQVSGVGHGGIETKSTPLFRGFHWRLALGIQACSL
jgi:hypothetical protein